MQTIRPDPAPGPDPTPHQLLKKAVPAALGAGVAGAVVALVAHRPVVYALLWIGAWLVIFGVGNLLHRRDR